MSTFSYGKHTKKHIGVWLRHWTNPDIYDLIKKSKNKRFFDRVERVVVSDYDKETDEVWLEVWGMNTIDVLLNKYRYNVIIIKTKVNEEWSCEGDIGNGKFFSNMN
jgi:hypothetical protein